MSANFEECDYALMGGAGTPDIKRKFTLRLRRHQVGVKLQAFLNTSLLSTLSISLCTLWQMQSDISELYHGVDTFSVAYNTVNYHA